MGVDLEKTEESKRQELIELIIKAKKRIIWAHKIQEKQCDIWYKWDKCIEMLNIFIAGVLILFSSEDLMGEAYQIIGIDIKNSIILLIFSVFNFIIINIIKYLRLSKVIGEHKSIACTLLELRDKYELLCFEILQGDITYKEAKTRFEILEEKKFVTYEFAPRTTNKAVELADKELNGNGED